MDYELQSRALIKQDQKMQHEMRRTENTGHACAGTHRNAGNFLGERHYVTFFHGSRIRVRINRIC